MKAPYRFWIAVFWVVGICLLAGGIYGFCSLADAADDYLSTTGVVDKVHFERSYKHRKIRTSCDVDVCYETTLYGKMHVTLDFYVPFLLEEGDSVDILYNPRLPRHVRFPGWESLLYGILLTFGSLLVAVGWRMAQVQHQKNLNAKYD